ncbi:MAG: abortive infection system antitoxin AbiGi family protein [Solirubrobacteraceae bacterium]
MYVSSELTHFVGRSAKDDEEAYGRLLSIIGDGWLLPHSARLRNQRAENMFALRMQPAVPLSTNERFLPEMVCFADIPDTDLEIHTGKYGRFGLAFSKSFLAPKGARPVLYVPHQATTQPLARHNDIRREWDELAQLFPDEVDPKFGGRTRSEHIARHPLEGEGPAERIADWVSHDLLAYVKFFDAALPADHEENFYMEREWRTVRSVRFLAADVTRVYVASGYEQRLGSDVPGLAGRVRGI